MNSYLKYHQITPTALNGCHTCGMGAYYSKEHWQSKTDDELLSELERFKKDVEKPIEGNTPKIRQRRARMRQNALDDIANIESEMLLRRQKRAENDAKLNLKLEAERRAIEEEKAKRNAQEAQKIAEKAQILAEEHANNEFLKKEAEAKAKYAQEKALIAQKAEQDRINAQKVANVQPAVNQPVTTPKPTKEEPKKPTPQKKDNTLLYAGLAVGGIVVFGTIVYFLKNKK